MRDVGWWHRIQQRVEPGAVDPADPFATWERQLTPAMDRHELARRLVIGVLLGFLLTASAAIAAAVLVLDRVFGSAGRFEPTARWIALSTFGAIVGGLAAYKWPDLTRLGRRFTICLAALLLILPSAAEYVEARTGHLSYGELHELAKLGGRSVCQIQLPARNGWPTGTYWMLNAPTNAGSLVTSHGGDRTWLHRYRAPMVCLD
jgi:hypothetical protein